MRRTEKATGGRMLFAGSEVKRQRNSLLASREEGISYGGVKMMITMETRVYW